MAYECFFLFKNNWDHWFDPLFGHVFRKTLILVPKHLSTSESKVSRNCWLGQFFEMRWKTHHTPVLAKGMICKISDFGLTRDVYVDDMYWKKSNGRSKCVNYFNLRSLWKWFVFKYIQFQYLVTYEPNKYLATTDTQIWSN